MCVIIQHTINCKTLCEWESDQKLEFGIAFLKKIEKVLLIHETSEVT